MSVDAETMKKSDYLPDEQIRAIDLVEDPLKTPSELFDELCEEDLKNPMTDDEIDAFVSGIRRMRHVI